MHFFYIVAILLLVAYLGDYIGIFVLLQGLNSALGMTLWFHTWKLTERFRQKDDFRDSLFPAFRRVDALEWTHM